MSDQIVEQVAQAIHKSFYVGKTPESEAWASYSTSHKSGFFDTARAAIDKYTDALAEGGYVIVPREPTEAMIEAGKYRICCDAAARDRTIHAYKAMWKAAPE